MDHTAASFDSLPYSHSAFYSFSFPSSSCSTFSSFLSPTDSSTCWFSLSSSVVSSSFSSIASSVSSVCASGDIAVPSMSKSERRRLRKEEERNAYREKKRYLKKEKRALQKAMKEKQKNDTESLNGTNALSNPNVSFAETAYQENVSCDTTNNSCDFNGSTSFINNISFTSSFTNTLSCSSSVSINSSSFLNSATDQTSSASSSSYKLSGRRWRRKIFAEKCLLLGDINKDIGQTVIEVAIDCDFEEYLNEKEVSSLKRQIMYSYNANKKAEKPFKMTVCGVGEKLEAELETIAGHDNWLFDLKNEKLDEIFPVDRLIYLTADSDITLEKLENGKVYVIGGVVDRNRHKNMTFNKCKAMNASTRRLPIQENMKLNASAVLTVNQVMSILVSFRQTNNWRNALEAVIPSRKQSS